LRINASESPTAKAMDRCDRHGDRGRFALSRARRIRECGSPHAGHEIMRALDDGNPVVFVSPDGRERIITAKMLDASRRFGDGA
jgi:hypothetical protein